MPEILKGLASLPQEQLIRKYYFPYQSNEADHSVVMYRLLLGLLGLKVFGFAAVKAIPDLWGFRRKIFRPPTHPLWTIFLRQITLRIAVFTEQRNDRRSIEGMGQQGLVRDR